MERDRTALGAEFGPGTGVLLPSRAAALEACRGAVSAGTGPVLITGEPGVGKTWLWRRLAAAAPASWLWALVEPTPATEAEAFYRALAAALGLSARGGVADLRPALAEALAERAADGRRRALVIDEAHNLSDALLEEVRVLSNRLGQADGFAALVLVGQTRLARRLAGYDLAGLDARLAARVHLRPIDADEARTLLRALRPSSAWDPAEVDRLHRDAAGNPRRLLGRIDREPIVLPRPARVPQPASRTKTATAAPEPIAEEFVPAAAEAVSPRVEVPLMGPPRPPLHEEEGLIEVGWEPAPADEVLPEVVPPEPSDATTEASGEELVEDRYAALQAWDEWARNQGRDPAVFLELSEADDGTRAPAAHPNLRIEGPDGFAPYSQLFSRLKQMQDPE